tara:strand:+ start:3490 stop:4578 length:1089 start_codon:yes stop_codon:yes gene_type:complete
MADEYNILKDPFELSSGYWNQYQGSLSDIIGQTADTQASVDIQNYKTQAQQDNFQLVSEGLRTTGNIIELNEDEATFTESLDSLREKGYDVDVRKTGLFGKEYWLKEPDGTEFKQWSRPKILAGGLYSDYGSDEYWYGKFEQYRNRPANYELGDFSDDEVYEAIVRAEHGIPDDVAWEDIISGKWHTENDRTLRSDVMNTAPGFEGTYDYGLPQANVTFINRPGEDSDDPDSFKTNYYNADMATQNQLYKSLQNVGLTHYGDDWSNMTNAERKEKFLSFDEKDIAFQKDWAITQLNQQGFGGLGQWATHEIVAKKLGIVKKASRGEYTEEHYGSKVGFDKDDLWGTNSIMYNLIFGKRKGKR